VDEAIVIPDKLPEPAKLARHLLPDRPKRRWVRIKWPELLTGIDVSVLDWQPRQPLPDPGQAAGDEAFKLLPHLIAAHLAADGWKVEHGTSGVSTFARATSDSGAELVSWPPHFYRRGKYVWPWSFVVRLHVQTLPFDPMPYLFARVGVRRYAKVFLRSNDRDLSVAIKAAAPWYGGQLPPVFGRATVRWRPGPKEKGTAEWTGPMTSSPSSTASTAPTSCPARPTSAPTRSHTSTATPTTSPPSSTTPASATSTRSAMAPPRRAGLRDLLARQTGMRSPGFPLGLPDAPIPADTRIVGLWAIRKNGLGNAAYPVAVGWDPAEPVVKILLPNGAGRWRPLPLGLLALSELKGTQALLDEDHTLNFIDALLDQLGRLWLHPPGHPRPEPPVPVEEPRQHGAAAQQCR
jgi:hypothetical protein